MLRRILLTALCALLPSLVFGQGSYAVDKNGCIIGRPCAYGVPLPSPPNQPTYAVDGDGCVIGKPCPWRGWRDDTSKIMINRQSANIYQTLHSPDGTTDVMGFNPRTGSQWDQQIDPGDNLQLGHNKFGQEWAAPLHRSSPYEPNWTPNFAVESRQAGQSHTRRHNFVEPGSAPPATTEATAASDELTIEEYVVQQYRSAAMAAIKARMRPGILGEAARAAARQRCLAIADLNARTVCMIEADGK